MSERRHTKRPRPGDHRPCPRCGTTIRFEEHFTVAHGELVIEKAAWICRNPTCLFEEYVRAEDRNRPLHS